MDIKIIGSKIAKARKAINISQAQLAERLFITPQAVGKWERGESFPDIITFNRLAELLGVDLNYFSESFPSVATQTVLTEPLASQFPELPSLKQKDKISWDMSSGNWVDADFSGLKNLKEKFSSSNIQRCKFIGSDLPGLLLKSNNLDSCDFSNSDISGSHIQTSHFDNNKFRHCSLREAKFSKSHLIGCDLSDANFDSSQIQHSHFDGNLFKNSSMKDAEFFKSYFNGCDFSGANFSGAVFRTGGLVNSKVENAVWNNTSFIGTHMEDIVFDGTLSDCYFENCVFNWVKFQDATLVNTFFKNNNFKRMGIRFVNCRADQITYELLKSGKADLTGIMLLNS